MGRELLINPTDSERLITFSYWIMKRIIVLLLIFGFLIINFLIKKKSSSICILGKNDNQIHNI